MIRHGITQAVLAAFEGKHISKICSNGYFVNLDNHCAHFVSHVLGFDFGYTCRQITGKGQTGANVRVHEVFGRCPQVGKWAVHSNPGAHLVFVTRASHVDLNGKRMANVPQKHVGICLNGRIWHYSNRLHKVLSQEPGQFMEYFRKNYLGADITLFYGLFPV